VESNTNQKGKSPKRPKLSDSPTPKKATSKTFSKETFSKGKVWLKRLYIRGAGLVDIGEDVTEEQFAAWKANTDVKIVDYIKEK
jgi:hypothetical protein